ncbi:85/88 kDa calcium-independent phospholipase A2-like [Argonauta hians]
MVDLFKSIVGNLVRGPYHVQISNTSDFSNQVLSEPPLYLYNERSLFYGVLKFPKSTTKVFSLFSIRDEGEAYATFNAYRHRLAELITPVPRDLDCNLLKKLCECLRENPKWSTAHVAAYIGMRDTFNNDHIRRHLNDQAAPSGETPLMVAIRSKNFHCVKIILSHGASLHLKDYNGNTAFHHAIFYKDVIKMFKDYSSPSVVNQKNNRDQTPFWLCCERGLLESCHAFLDIGADPYAMTHGIAPVHLAMKKGDTGLLEFLCSFDPNLASQRDEKYGGCPVHWLHLEEQLEILRCNMIDVDAVSIYHKRSALHVMLEKKRYKCAMALLFQNIDPNMQDTDGNTALHIAVSQECKAMLRTLVIFGADLDVQNRKQQTPRHIAALLKTEIGQELVYLLNQSGAKRCGKNVSGCLRGCVAGGSYNGSIKTPLEIPPDSDAALDELLFKKVKTRTGDPQRIGHRVLCLDGGGIRGLITIQILIEIEKLVGRPIRECFDWIAGTSTGGILALAIAQGKSLNYCKSFYFRMKNEIFFGKRPYSSDKLEQLLKQEFGEETVMADLKRPKVMVTAVVADQIPPRLHLFQNYSYTLDVPNGEKTSTVCPATQKVWHAARCSGAAPTFFRACGKYLDGGLMSNNPTLDALTEIHQYNLAMEQKKQPALPLTCVVSVGTGRKPTVPVKSMDVYLPENFFDLAICAVRGLALKDLILHQVTNTDDQPVQQARSWCSMLNIPYFRFNPAHSEEILLDCQDSKKIVDIMWETLTYCNTNKARFQALADILRPLQ